MESTSNLTLICCSRIWVQSKMNSDKVGYCMFTQFMTCDWCLELTTNQHISCVIWTGKPNRSTLSILSSMQWLKMTTYHSTKEMFQWCIWYQVSYGSIQLMFLLYSFLWTVLKTHPRLFCISSTKLAPFPAVWHTLDDDYEALDFNTTDDLQTIITKFLLNQFNEQGWRGWNFSFSQFSDPNFKQNKSIS